MPSPLTSGTLYMITPNTILQNFDDQSDLESGTLTHVLFGVVYNTYRDLPTADQGFLVSISDNSNISLSNVIGNAVPFNFIDIINIHNGSMKVIASIIGNYKLPNN